MKVHNDLKELLKSYHKHLNRIDNFGNDNPELVVKIFLDFNSLASVEPEPLAKNKQTENKLFNCQAQEIGRCSCTIDCVLGEDELNNL